MQHTDASLYYPLRAPFPVSLPDIKLTKRQMTFRYGLLVALCGGRNKPENLPSNIPLKAEIPRFKRYAMDEIRLDRSSSFVTTSTFEDYLGDISKVLGYFYHFLGVRCH